MATSLIQSGIQFPDSTIQTTAAEGDIPSGSRMVFYQANAPTGWSQVTSINDRVLRVVSGDGGTTGGSWSISGISVSGHSLTEAELPAHSHSFSGSGNTSSDGSHSHTGSTTTTGSHNHSIAADDATGPGGEDGLYSNSLDRGTTTYMYDAVPTSSSGSHSHSLSINSNGSHSHSFSVSGTTGNTGSGSSHSHGISHDGNWRPSYADVIVCERN